MSPGAEPAGEIDESSVLARWKQAEQSVTAGNWITATWDLLPACDATICLALGHRKMRSFPDAEPGSPAQAADFARSLGVTPPPVLLGSAAEAETTALAALAVLPRSAVLGLRLGLAAHAHFLVDSNEQTPEMRYQLQRFGPPWARALIGCAQALDQLGHRQLALHFARWAANVTGHLGPFRDLPGIEAVITESLQLAARLESAVGDPAAARQINESLSRRRP